MRSVIVSMFRLANIFFFGIMFAVLIIEVIASRDVNFLMHIEFWSSFLSHPLLWSFYLFTVVLFTAKPIYAAVVRNQND